MTANFSLDTSTAIHYRRRFHKCQVTMILMHPFYDWQLNCSHYFPTYYGRLKNPCDIVSKSIKMT